METFSSEETERIIARAARMQGKEGIVNRMDLLRIADQMGIDVATVNKAIAAEMEASEKAAKIDKKRQKELQGFYYHLASYAIVNGFLLFVDLVTGPGFWVYWPMLAWGVGLAFHALPFVFQKTLGPIEQDH